MKTIGLTGSIASGKTTVAAIFRAAGVPVFDADAAVHELYRDRSFARRIELAIPGSTDKDGVSRPRLAGMVLQDAALLQRLEAIVHPEVHIKQKLFEEECRASGHTLGIVDVPLLFEKNREHEFDATILVCAPESVRKSRAMQRPGMTGEKWQQINRLQMSELEKRHRAGFIIENDGSLAELEKRTLAVIDHLRSGLGVKPK